MDPNAIAVQSAGVALIILVLWYFFGETTRTTAAPAEVRADLAKPGISDEVREPPADS